MQPGLVKTDIGLKHTFSFHGLMWKIRRLVGKSPEKGAATSVYLANAEEVKGISGKYWDNCKIKSASSLADFACGSRQALGFEYRYVWDHKGISQNNANAYYNTRKAFPKASFLILLGIISSVLRETN